MEDFIFWGGVGRLLELLDQQHFNFPTIADTAELGKLSLFKDHSSNLQSDYTTACSFIISVFPFIFTENLKKITAKNIAVLFLIII